MNPFKIVLSASCSFPLLESLWSPPGNWTIERKLNYLTWAEDILNGLKGTNPLLEEHLSQLIKQGRQVFQNK